MKQKLMAVAVAGALAVPGLAAAQVTISGQLGAGLTQGKISNPSAGRAGNNLTSMFMETDATIRFSVVEDLGGGTQFYGAYEFRPVLDAATDTTGAATDGFPDALAVGSTSPPAYVGLRNTKVWGSFRMGAISVSKGALDGPTAYHYSGGRVTDYVQVGASPTSLISGRWRNSFVYNSPQMGGFKVEVNYSTAPLTNDQDFTTASRKGRGIMINPEFDAGFANFGYARFDIRAEADAGAPGPFTLGGTTQQNYKGDKLWVHGNLGPVKAGIIYAKWKGDLGGAANVRQTGWYVPFTYQVANHTFGVMVGKARDNTAVAGDQSAKYRGIAYNYGFSKRTSMSASYNKIDNGANAAYDLSGATGVTDGVVGFTTVTAEDHSAISFALHHSF